MDRVVQELALEDALDVRRKASQARVIAQIHQLMREAGLTVDDVFPHYLAGKLPVLWRPQRPPKPADVKYADPATGATWCGRGRTPKWLKRRDPAEFLVVKSSTVGDVQS